MGFFECWTQPKPEELRNGRLAMLAFSGIATVGAALPKHGELGETKDPWRVIQNEDKIIQNLK